MTVKVEETFLETLTEASELEFFYQSLERLKLPTLPANYRYKYDWRLNSSELKIQKRELIFWVTKYKSPIQPEQDEYYSYLKEIESVAEFLANKLYRKKVISIQRNEEAFSH